MAVELNVLQPSPPEAFDNSMLSTFQRCPRKAFYEYYLDRASDGKNWSIQFGVAYHRFREVLEKAYISACRKDDRPLHAVEDKLFDLAWSEALKVEGGFEDPPAESRKSYLHKTRLLSSCEDAFENWREEKRGSTFDVIYAEQPFELELPNGEYYTGRMDQIVRLNGRKLWVRDFKTTSRMGRTYAKNFDPNNQMTGYVWAAQQLSGQDVEGVIIEVLYNTKNNGPEFHQFLSTRTPEQVAEWEREISYEVDTARQYEEDMMFPKRTTACSDYGGCFYRDACSKSHWRTRERWLESNTIHSHWDPMNPDEEEGNVD